MRKYLPTVLTLWIAFVFVQSLFFKFSNSPETQHIFGTLDAWGASLGFPGLFAPSGIFSQYVIGSAELVASSLLLLGLLPRLRILRPLGALVSVAVISGAILFHLFTPLGVVIDGDGGLLFGMACSVWIAGLVLLLQSRDLLLARLHAVTA
ncbi:hypothetical protein [Roseiterribacter gracilis]|uniref:DoxX family protein n=1 Tax=Roseiterribacter gracilis TaxID=2812848 RepID=A0A8S8XEC3_9PROT|nr:hypothetical protein TMPK1_24680 [Rhodospirillales bacterium TMPK1]